MMDRDEGSMSKWSGNAEYYLNRLLLTEIKRSWRKHENSLVVSTSLLDRKRPHGN